MPSLGGKGSADLVGLHFFSLSWQKERTELISTKPSLCPPWDQELARSQIITLTTQLCPSLFLFLSRVQLCDPMDCSPPGSSVHGILQARILEWGAISFSGWSSWPRDQTHVSCFAGGFFFFFNTEPPGKPSSVLACMFFFSSKVKEKRPKPMVMWSFHERKELLTPSRWGLGGTGSSLEVGRAFREQREPEWHTASGTLVMMCVYQELNKCKMGLCGFLVQKSGNTGTAPATR